MAFWAVEEVPGMVDTLRSISLTNIFRKLLVSAIRIQRIIQRITRSYHQQRDEEKARMATVDDKKRVAGSKVSAIANIFQSKPQNDGGLAQHHHRPTTIHPEGGFKEPAAPLKDSPTQVTVVRTESHVARFNNARALFEKLGEENKTNRP